MLVTANLFRYLMEANRWTSMYVILPEIKPCLFSPRILGKQSKRGRREGRKLEERQWSYSYSIFLFHLSEISLYLLVFNLLKHWRHQRLSSVLIRQLLNSLVVIWILTSRSVHRSVKKNDSITCSLFDETGGVGQDERIHYTICKGTRGNVFQAAH